MARVNRKSLRLHKPIGPASAQKKRQELAAANANANPARVSGDDVGQPKREVTTAQDIMDNEPSSLTDAERGVLVSKANALYGSQSRVWWEIGRVVSVLVSTAPKATAAERRAEFASALEMSYQTAMKAKRVYEAYRDSPSEVEEYGVDTADRLKGFSKDERQDIWDRTGTEALVKEFLQSRNKAPKKAAKSKVTIKASGRTRDLGNGIRVQHQGKACVFTFDLTKIDRKKVYKALTSITGVEYVLEK